MARRRADPNLRNQWFAAKKDYAWPSAPGVSEDLWKVEVVCEDYVAVTARMVADLAILGLWMTASG